MKIEYVIFDLGVEDEIYDKRTKLFNEFNEYRNKIKQEFDDQCKINKQLNIFVSPTNRHL